MTSHQIKWLERLLVVTLLNIFFLSSGLILALVVKAVVNLW